MKDAAFNNARGTASSLQLAPPFAFKDVTMSVFPLRANLSRLESFCDAYLNHASEAIKFQPFIPFVYLIVLDYGRMSVEAANMGWISQREVAFSVPLRWMQRKSEEEGILEFRDWAFSSPFIFVDNELSMSTGREVYGWPKTLAHLDPTISEWVKDPPGSRRVFNVTTKAVGKAFSGERFAERPFLDVYHRPATNILEFPPSLLNMFKPIAEMPNFCLGGARLSRDLMMTLSGIAAQGITKTSAFPDILDVKRLKQLLSRENLMACMKMSSWQPGIDDLIWSLFPRFYANTINLKQFRDAASTVEACYQAITNAKMTLKCVNRAGPLGQQNLLMGQVDGGYRIDMYRHGNLPIIDALGLEVASSHQDGDVDIATLQPVCPFWMQVDMDYARGDVVTWRSSSTAWKWQVKSERAPLGTKQIDFEVEGRDLPDDVRRVADVTHDGKDQANVQAVVNYKPTVEPADNLYNTARGAGEELSGPFLSPNTTIRVLPLLADEAKLNQFVSSYLNVEGHARYKAWGRHVYLLIYNYPSRSSESQNVGLIANREINFAVPIKCYDWSGDDKEDYDFDDPGNQERLDREKLTGTALVVPFAYVDDVTVAITSSEVEGVPTLQSAIDSPPSRWMDTDGPDTSIGSMLLDSSALVLPSLGVGAGARTQSFLSISTKPPIRDRDEAGWRQIAKSWGQHLRGDLLLKFRQRGNRGEFKSQTVGRKEYFRHVRAFALEMLAGKLPIISLTLKQFRDSWNTETACYQSLVQGRRQIDRLHELQEIEQSLHVSITRFPTQPIAEVLGLIPKHTKVGGEGIVDVFEALRPFWLRADLRKDLGKNLFERVGSTEERAEHGHWVRQEHIHQQFGWHPTTPDELAEIELKKAELRKGLRITFERLSGNKWKGVEETLENVGIDEFRRNYDDDIHRNLKILWRDQWHPITPHELAKLDEVRVTFERRSGDDWVRIEKVLEDRDIAELRQGRAGRTYRNLMIWWRAETLPLMVDPMRLNVIDREHIPDLAAYLESLPTTSHPISYLARCVSEVDPATVIDSILSRQWACPEHKRRQFGKSDFCVQTRSFGIAFEDHLFPEGERQERFWPQDSEFKRAYDDIQIGLVLQIQRGVWEAIEEAQQALDEEAANKSRSKIKGKSSDGPKANENKKVQDYLSLARNILPTWFQPNAEGCDPVAWDQDRWDELASAMQQLIDESDGIVPRDPTIRRLIALRKEMQGQPKVRVGLRKKARDEPLKEEDKPIDPDEDPIDVSKYLRKRLDSLAGVMSDKDEESLQAE